MKFNQDYFIEEFQNLIIKDNFLSNNSKLFLSYRFVKL